MRFLLLIIITSALVACWYFLYPSEGLSPPNPEEVASVPPMVEESIDEQTPTYVEGSSAPLEEGKFTPPKLEEVRLGSDVVFKLPTGSVYQGIVDSIEAKGQTTTIVQGDIPAGGFFIFSYGPSAVFGSVTTPEGSFEYLKSGGSEVFRRPPVGKLSNDIIRPNPGRGKTIDG